MHTKDILAAELRKAGLISMAEKAESGWYHAYLSPLNTPGAQLDHDLTIYANAPGWPRKDEAKALLERHMNGEFDASREESEAWAASKEGREAFDRLKPDRRGRPAANKPGDSKNQTLGDAPIEEAQMIAVAGALDEIFNGDAKGPDKKVGFVLLVFDYGEKEGRANYISNGADRRDIITLFKEQIARFEGQPEMSGRA